MRLDWELALPRSLDLLAWRSLLPFHLSGACTLINQEDSQLAAVQAEARPGPGKCALMRLGLTPHTNSSILSPLLEALCVHAVEHGAGRVFAAIADEEGASLLRRLGFLAYGDETIYRMIREETREEEVSRQAASFAIRPLRARDVWGVHTLYAAVTPRPVQLLEGLTSEDWEFRLPHRVAWPGMASEVRLVLEAEAGVSGYLGLTRGRRGHRMEMMVHPRQRALAGPLLQAGLDIAARWQPLPVYFALRGYQSELAQALESAGFETVGAQTLMVKQMTVRVRQRLRVFEPVLERRLEPAATRVQRS
jgi:N-acetylglutamate synthase-like GNAT family acetyltransferase